MPFELTRRRLLETSAALVSLGVAGCLDAGGADRWDTDATLSVSNAHQYSARGCSCCERYAPYVQDHLATTLETSVPDDLAAVKRRYGVPVELQSCHTLVLDEYVVEGHVPVAVIAKVLDEAPAIDGLALPGMPAGSPGMGGEQTEPFTFYAIGGGRTGEVYAEL